MLFGQRIQNPIAANCKFKSTNLHNHLTFSISTRFCDVLIVLYVVSPVLIRVHIETQNPDIQFGPLFDGMIL